MMRYLLTLPALFAAGPALAAKDYGLIDLRNTDFVVFLGFAVFVGILLYFKVPSIIASLLDNRAKTIQSELDEARALREEAQSLLAKYERQAREAQDEARRMVDAAREEAEANAKQAKADMEASVARRLAAAEDQIATAEAKAVKEVRDRAIRVAVSAARDVIAREMTPDARASMIDASIQEVGARLN